MSHAAIAAITQWRYEPSTQNGVPVPVLITVIMDFTLDDQKEDERDVPI